MSQLLMERRGTRIALGVFTALVVAFLWIPIVIICVYAFNSSNVQSWPIAGFTHEVVLAGDPRPGHAGGARAVAEGGAARDHDRARARLDRLASP